MAEKGKKEFHVEGPFDIEPAKGKKGGKIITGDDEKNFWKNEGLKEISEKRGCYVFCVKASKGSVPWYVGLTKKKTMKDEALAPTKINKYNEVLADKARGTPQLFFIVADNPKPSKKYIGEIEHYLIDIARAKNPNLKVDKGGTQESKWKIKGIGGKGKLGPAERDFSSMMDLDKGKKGRAGSKQKVSGASQDSVADSPIAASPAEKQAVAESLSAPQSSGPVADPIEKAPESEKV